MTIAPATLVELKRRARDAATRAYAPYSSFPVGAAVLAAGGAIHTGANVENASYGLSICAERAAIFEAVAHGARRIEAIVRGFGPDAVVVCCTDDERAERTYALAELLPGAFGLEQLERRR